MGDSNSTETENSPPAQSPPPPPPPSSPPPPNKKSPSPSSSTSSPPPPSNNKSPPPSPSSSSPPPPSPLPPPPPSSSSSSPPPSSTQSPPPPSSPPPDSKSSPQLSPPPSSNSPLQSSPPPSNPNPSPPPSQNNPSNPPPGVSNNGSPPGTSSSNNSNGNGNNNNNNNTQWLPPPDSTSSNNPQNSNVSSNSSSSNNNGSSMLSIPLVAVAGAGVVLLVLLLLLLFVACRRKRHKEPNNGMPYYNNRPNATGYYTSTTTPSPQPRTNRQTDGGGGGGGGVPFYKSTAQNHNHNNGDPFYNKSTAQNQNHNTMHANNHDQINDLPQIPGGRPKAGMPKPPPPVISSDMSHTSSSGPDGPVLPPPPPIVALGLNQSSFTYEELSAATGGFTESNLLGQGGFGYVHKGTLPNGKEIAVKSLKSGSGQGEREFKAEVEIISRVHHRHLVSLVGFCIAGGKRLLVYEFVPNNNLDYHLHGKGHPIMDWPTRLKVALGAAKGLAYLHEDCHPRIIHRDIKSSNILIDFACEAQVADFGLAKLTSDNNTHVSTRVMGTFGYLAPEYASTGKLTEKSDVFSFGVVLLELITGRRPVDPTRAMEDSLVDWARPLCLRALEDRNFNELADPYLEKKYPVEEMARMVACAGAAVRHSARRRPRISQIIRALEGDVSLEDLSTDIKPSQQASVVGVGSASSSAIGNTTSVDEDNILYTEDLKKLKKMAGDNAGDLYVSSEYGATSEYGVNPSSSSSSSSEFESHDHTPHK